MMTNKEARSVIECLITNIVGDFADKELPKGAKHTFDALKKAEYMLDMYSSHDLRKESGLPDDGIDVLCLNDNGKLFVGKYLDKYGLWFDDQSLPEKVIKWWKLPDEEDGDV